MILTEPVTCSTCGAVSVNGGTLHCHGCYSALTAQLAEKDAALQAATQQGVIDRDEQGRLRSELEQMTAAKDHAVSEASRFFYALLKSQEETQAAIQRAEEANARSEKAYEVIRRVGDHVDRMREGEMSYSIVDRVRECRTQRDALQARVGKLEEAAKEAVSLLALRAVRFSDGVPVGPVGNAHDLLAAALASREGGEG